MPDCEQDWRTSTNPLRLQTHQRRTDATAMLTTCHCQHCQAPVEFEAETWKYGETRTCASCGQESRVYLPIKRGSGQAYQAGAMVGDIPQSTLALIYAGAVLMPLVGFFGGIYLLAKSQPGHGVICMALSVAFAIFWLVMLNSF